MWDQFDYVQDRPLVPHVVIPPRTMKSLLCVGYRDKVANLRCGTTQREELDHEFIRRFPSTCYDKYKWMFPTVEMVNKATMRYDEEISLDLDPRKTGLAFSLLCEMYSELINSCVVLESSEVKMNMQSSVGPNMEYEFHSVRQALDGAFDEFETTWRYAHRIDKPVYYKASGKTEMLPSEKVDAGNARTFLFPDVADRHCGQRMNQDINNKMGALRTTWSAIGFDRTHGGFTRLATEFDHWFTKFEGDLHKWDARMARFLLMICCMFRWCCYQPHHRTEDNWTRLIHQYKNKIMTLIYHPTGQIIYYPHGNKSGQDSTSYDNTIGHSFVHLYGAIDFLEHHGFEVTLRNIRLHLHLRLYGDDSLGGGSKLWTDWCKKLYGGVADRLDHLYTAFGMHFKKDECKEQRTLEGLKFIGGIFKRTSYGWAHTFSVSRALCAMVRNVDQPDPTAKWSKYLALYCLLAFEPERKWVREWMVKTYHYNIEHGIDVNCDMYIPDDYDLHAFWFGWETTQSIGVVELEKWI
nr:MAG: RNA-dependent RNA polymerase [Astroviridae sp.]